MVPVAVGGAVDVHPHDGLGVAGQLGVALDPAGGLQVQLVHEVGALDTGQQSISS